MSEQATSRKTISTAGALFIAGLLSSVSAMALLPKNELSSYFSIVANPVFAKVLKDAKRLQKSGKWKKSTDVLKPYATPDNPLVLLEYGKLLARGWGVPRNLEKAREKLLLAVQREFSKRGEAAFELAKVYRQSSGEDCARIAYEWFAKAASWGFVKAHAELGRHHARGIGVPVNTKRALEEFQIASRNGSATALLAFLQLISKNATLGEELPPLHLLMSDAIPLLEQEASAGKAASSKALGRLYLDDVLASRDPAKAKYWFRRGADLGDSGAMCELAMLMLEGLPTETEIAEALGWMRLAVKLNNAGAITEFGRLHVSERFGLKKDRAINLFERGIKAAHPGSMLEMAKLHLDGSVAAKNEDRAKKLLKRGAAFGHEGSASLLRKVEGKKDLRRPDFVSILEEGFETPKVRTLPSQQNLKTKPSQHPLSGATVIIPFGRKG